jgi:hypothetical protein
MYRIRYFQGKYFIHYFLVCNRIDCKRRAQNYESVFERPKVLHFVISCAVSRTNTRGLRMGILKYIKYGMAIIAINGRFVHFFVLTYIKANIFPKCY